MLTKLALSIKIINKDYQLKKVVNIDESNRYIKRKIERNWI